jgi:cellulose synthase/poly-beta-1,6-N-acetylglucosamine synthase-like glycosyltransferase
MLTILVIIPIGLIFYHFFLFHIGLIAISNKFPKNSYERLSDDFLPDVSLLISAKNEESCIEDKIENSLALNYPKGKLKITIIANGCTDKTVSIVKRYFEKGINLIEYNDIGKTEAQNKAVNDSNSEIIVFSDSNTPYECDAIRNLILPFSDPSIGAVSGRHIYTNTDDATGASESTYWNLIETKLKISEARVGGIIGANGSIYAVRKKCYVPLPPDVISDFIEPLLIASNGFRTEYAPEAIAYEKSEKEFSDEYNRKSRIVQRSVYSLLKYPQLLNPSINPRLALMLFSHKVLRWLTPFLAVISLSASTLQVVRGKGTKLNLFIFIGFTILGFFALLGRGVGREKSVPGLTHAYYIFLMFKAAMVGVYKAITEGEYTTWNPTR